MRYFFTRRGPAAGRILLVESGSRPLLEGLLPGLRNSYGDVDIDLVTCYPGCPAGLDPEASSIYRVSRYRGPVGRRRLYRELAARNYTTLGIVCSGEPLMTKWKWAIAARVPAKVMVINENGDYFWLDWGQWRTMLHFVLFRAGLTEEGVVRTLARVCLFPFALLYLLLYASFVHFRRVLRQRLTS